MNKRFLQVISAALCVLLLAGCGAKAEDSAGTADDGQQWLSLIHISEPTRP